MSGTDFFDWEPAVVGVIIDGLKSSDPDTSIYELKGRHYKSHQLIAEFQKVSEVAESFYALIETDGIYWLDV